LKYRSRVSDFPLDAKLLPMERNKREKKSSRNERSPHGPGMASSRYHARASPFFSLRKNSILICHSPSHVELASVLRSPMASLYLHAHEKLNPPFTNIKHVPKMTPQDAQTNLPLLVSTRTVSSKQIKSSSDNASCSLTKY